MTRSAVIRLFAVSSTLIVLGLIGGAMLHKKVAPAIRGDIVRPHGERGPCLNCHQIIAGAKTPRTALPVPALAPGSALLAQAATQPALPQQGRPRQALLATVSQPRHTTMDAAAAAAAPLPALTSSAALAPPAQAALAPAIVEGMRAPHGLRGPCGACHPMIQANAVALNPASPRPQPMARVAAADAWRPTPPLDALRRAAGGIPRRDPIEVEAFGMSVRPTQANPRGMMVVEVEGMARRAGIQLGDLVRAMDGQVTTSVPLFLRASRTADPGRGVVIDTVRDGQAKVMVLR